MGSQAVAIISAVLLTFHGRVVGLETCCPELTLPAGLYFTDAPVTYEAAETVGVACELGYVAAEGSSSGKCSNNCGWSWGNGNTPMLQCAKGCLAPNLTQGVEYVAGNAITSYSSGTTVSLKCSASYGLKVGSTTGTCDETTFTWTWEAGTQLECDPACPAPALTTGVELASGSSPEYTLDDVITLQCSSGYASTGGGTSATCTSSNTWQWNGPGMLQCSQACPPPTLPIGTEFASGSSLEYTLNEVIFLRCSNGYASAGGDESAVCSSSNTWQWNEEGMLQCVPVCSLPTLPTGVQLLSSTTETYLFGSKITAGCISNYGYFSGSYEATCGNNNVWSWTSLGQLQCRPTCRPPAVGVNATISPSFAKDIYLLNDYIQFECVGGYVPLSGSATGVCSSMNQWTWLAGTTASLSCVIAPPYKEQVSSTFKPSTCQSYVTRSAPTPSTCLISCLNDGYCRGYAFDGTVCYVDRPFIEATLDSSMACLSRQ